MINTSFQNYQIFASAEPLDNDLIQAYKNYKVQHILSLDRDVASRVAQKIKKLNLPMTQVVFHIDPGNPAGQATNLFNNIQLYFNQFPILVHCKQGKDRTGFAIASWLIKTGKYNACNAVAAVTKSIGYGTGGISKTSKNTMDRILGCSEGTITTDEDLTIDDAATMIEDALSIVDDAVDKMRGTMQHQQQSPYAGTVDAGPIADNLRYNNWSDPIKEIYPGNYDYPMDGPAINVAASNIIIRSSARQKILKRILKLIKEIKDKNNLESGPSLIEGDLLGAELPSGVGYAFPHQPKGITGIGLSDNYTGLGAYYLNNPSSAPGAGNAASPVEPTGYIQL